MPIRGPVPMPIDIKSPNHSQRRRATQEERANQRDLARDKVTAFCPIGTGLSNAAVGDGAVVVSRGKPRVRLDLLW
jgi:hypothetical protein